MADAHQTPIWIRYGRIAHRGATTSTSARSSPRKSSVPAAAQVKSQCTRARRQATSQSVGDSATRRIEPTTVHVGQAWANHQSLGFSPVRSPIYPGPAEPSLHEQALRCEGHLITQNVKTGACELMGKCLQGQHGVALTSLALVEALRCR